MRDYLYLIILFLVDLIVLKDVLIRMGLEFIRLLKFKRDSLVAKGLIVDYYTTQDLDQYTQYAPIVEYQTKEGETHTLYSDEFRMMKPVKGKSVTVSYNPHDASEGVVDIDSRIRFGFFLFLFMSLILIGVNYTVISSFL